MCHRAHQNDPNPVLQVADNGITADVNFTGIALAAQDAGLEALGYTNQARCLINCGLAQAVQTAPMPQRVVAQILLMEHKTGELFNVIVLCKGVPWDALSVVNGDQTHRRWLTSELFAARHPCIISPI